MKNKVLYLLLLMCFIANSQTAYTPSNMSFCDEDNDGVGIFNIEEATSEVLGGQSPSEYTVTYHETFEQATTGLGDLSSPYENIIAYSQVIYVRLEKNATGEYDTTSLNLTVNDIPVLSEGVIENAICDFSGSSTDGIAEFDLTTSEDEILAEVTGGMSDYSVTYHLTETEAVSGDAAIAAPTSYVNMIPFSQIIYALSLIHI